MVMVAFILSTFLACDLLDDYTSKTENFPPQKNGDPVMIPKFSCHICRHTFASRFCENETNIKIIQAVMGHADVSTTMNIYAEVNNAVTSSALNDLSKKWNVF